MKGKRGTSSTDEKGPFRQKPCLMPWEGGESKVEGSHVWIEKGGEHHWRNKTFMHNKEGRENRQGRRGTGKACLFTPQRSFLWGGGGIASLEGLVGNYGEQALGKRSSSPWRGHSLWTLSGLSRSNIVGEKGPRGGGVRYLFQGENLGLHR